MRRRSMTLYVVIRRKGPAEAGRCKDGYDLCVMIRRKGPAGADGCEDRV